MQKLQNRATKLIPNSPFDVLPLSSVINLLRCSTVINLEPARIVYESLNGDAPCYMSDILTKVNVITTRPLGNSDYDLSSGAIFGGKVIGTCHYQKKVGP